MMDLYLPLNSADKHYSDPNPWDQVAWHTLTPDPLDPPKHQHWKSLARHKAFGTAAYLLLFISEMLVSIFGDLLKFYWGTFVGY